MESEEYKAGRPLWHWGRHAELLRIRGNMRLFLTAELFGIMLALWWRNETYTTALLILSWVYMTGISAKLSRL